MQRQGFPPLSRLQRAGTAARQGCRAALFGLSRQGDKHLSEVPWGKEGVESMKGGILIPGAAWMS